MRPRASPLAPYGSVGMPTMLLSSLPLAFLSCITLTP